MNTESRSGPGGWVALILLVFAAQMLLYLPYVTDDTYIYGRFARNLAEHGELAFNLGQPVHAITSPLWAGLGALGAIAGAARGVPSEPLPAAYEARGSDPFEAGARRRPERGAGGRR